MTGAWPFDPGNDPLYRDVPLRHTAELPVLGIPVRFESNAAHVLGVVEQAFGSWRSLDKSLRSTSAVRVRVIVHQGSNPDPVSFPFAARMPDNERLLIHTPGSLALADVARRDGVIYATQGLVEAGERFVHSVLDTVVLLLVTHLDRTPVHAAMIMRRGSAVLLAAPAGTGKSTVAYTAHRAGLRVASDDTTYIQLDPRLRFWGAGRAVRVPAAMRRWFDELGADSVPHDADGDGKLVVPLHPMDREAPVVERAVVCVLTRSEPHVRLQRLDREAVKASLASGMEPGFDRFPGRIDGVLARVVARGGWRLNLSGDPRDALAPVEQMLADLDTQG